MLEVADVENDIHDCLAVGGAGFDVADVGFGVANHAGDQLQHAVAVVAKNGELHGVNVGRRFILRPRNVDAALRLVHEVHDIRTTHGVHRYALAPCHVADDPFAADRVATACAVDQQVARAFDGDGVVVAAENPSYHAADCGFRFASFTLRQAVVGSRSQFGQYLTS